MPKVSYMCQNRHGTYYARFIIPKSLRQFFKNKSEIRRSLQTDSKRLATKRARVFRVEFDDIVDKLMKQPSSKASAERAKRMTEELFAKEEAVQRTHLITHLDIAGNLITIDHGNPVEERKTLEALIAAQQGQQPTPANNTVSECLDAYIAYKMTPGRKKSWGEGTARQKPQKLRAFRQLYGDKPLSHLGFRQK